MRHHPNHPRKRIKKKRWSRQLKVTLSCDQPAEKNDGTLTITDAAKQMGIPRKELTRMIRAGVIKAQNGRIHPDTIREWKT